MAVERVQPDPDDIPEIPKAPETQTHPNTVKLTLRLPPGLLKHVDELEHRFERYKALNKDYAGDGTTERAIRMSYELHEDLTAAARTAGVTLNKFVQYLLRDKDLRLEPESKSEKGWKDQYLEIPLESVTGNYPRSTELQTATIQRALDPTTGRIQWSVLWKERDVFMARELSESMPTNGRLAWSWSAAHSKRCLRVYVGGLWHLLPDMFDNYVMVSPLKAHPDMISVFFNSNVRVSMTEGPTGFGTPMISASRTARKFSNLTSS